MAKKELPKAAELARKAKHLQGDIKSNGKLMKVKEWLDGLIAEGVTLEAKEIVDKTAKNKIIKEYESLRKSDYPFGNKNHPTTKEVDRLADIVKNEKFPTKMQYRAYKPGGSFHELSKWDYDYLVENEGLAKGIAVEQEHKGTLEKLAKGKISVPQAVAETAKDHLKEDPEYYDKFSVKEIEGVSLENTAIQDVITLHPDRKYGNLDFAEAKELYQFKEGKSGYIFGDASTLKEEILQALDNMGYIQFYDNEDGMYDLTDLGKEFISAVNARIQTIKNVQAGVDLFPEDVKITPVEKTYRDIKSCLLAEGDDESQYIFEGKEIEANGENWRIKGFFKYGCILEYVAKNKLSSKKKDRKLTFNEIVDMFKKQDIEIPGINGIVGLNQCIKLLEKCIDIIDLKEKVLDSIKIVEPPEIITEEPHITSYIEVGDTGMFHGGEVKVLSFDDIGNAEIVEIDDDGKQIIDPKKVSAEFLQKTWAKFPKEESWDKLSKKWNLPKDGSIINITAPAIGPLPERKFELKYDSANFVFDVYENGKFTGPSIYEKDIINNLENGFYLISEKINTEDFSEAISTLDMLLQDEPNNKEWAEAKETLEMLSKEVSPATVVNGYNIRYNSFWKHPIQVRSIETGDGEDFDTFEEAIKYAKNG